MMLRRHHAAVISIGPLESFSSVHVDDNGISKGHEPLSIHSQVKQIAKNGHFHRIIAKKLQARNILRKWSRPRANAWRIGRVLRIRSGSSQLKGEDGELWI